MVKCYVTGLDAAFEKVKIEYDAYIVYQECSLRGEVERMNLPGDEGNIQDDDNEEGDGNVQKDDGGDESEEYFPDEHWPPSLRLSATSR